LYNANTVLQLVNQKINDTRFRIDEIKASLNATLWKNQLTTGQVNVIASKQVKAA
jgi:hypothetical protein